jgi:hypothetical protein
MDYGGLLVEFGYWGEVFLEEGIEDDLVDIGQVGCGAGGWAREVGSGDAEAGEEEAGLLVVDVMGGDAAEDFEEGELDGVAVVDAGHLEGAVIAMRVGGFAAGAVVIEAEVVAAEGGRAAAGATGVDVAALIATGWIGWHVGGVHFEKLLYLVRKVRLLQRLWPAKCIDFSRVVVEAPGRAAVKWGRPGGVRRAFFSFLPTP